MIKLRMVRTLKELPNLRIDPRPDLIEKNQVVQSDLSLANCYSVPGTAHRDQNPPYPIVIDFGPDELLKAHQFHPVLLKYTLTEPLKKLYKEPFVEARQPVGNERMVIEIHMPAGYYYERKAAGASSGDIPKLEVQAVDKANRSLEDIPKERFSLTGGRHDFNDGRGKHDWFRVTIHRPPQEKDVRVAWFWDLDTAKKL